MGLAELPLAQRLRIEGETAEHPLSRPKPPQGSILAAEEAAQSAPSTLWEEEQAKAQLYRDQWDARIAYRQNQLAMYSGNSAAFRLLWESWRVPYDPTNYINETPGNEGGYTTVYDYDTNGLISSSPVRLRNTRHASDQNDHPHPED